MNTTTPRTALTATMQGTVSFAGPSQDVEIDALRHHHAGPLSLAWTGHPHFEDGDASTFLASIRSRDWQDPTALLSRINGPFAIAIVDAAKRRCLLAVDRLGIMPLAYRQRNGRLFFGSTLDLLREADPSGLEIDPQAIYDYLYFHMIPAPRTVYRDVSKLEPAGYVLCTEEHCHSGRYWDIPYREEAPARPEAEEQLRQLLEDAVVDNLEGTATGTFLSGGLDSTTVSGYFSRRAPAPHRAFSVGFDAEGYDETPWAREAASHYGLELSTYYVTPDDVCAAVPRIAAAYDEPFGNASAIPAYFCARRAREAGIECLLAGDGGDELFAGNSRYARQLIFAHYDALPRWLRKGMLEPLARPETPLHRLPLARKLVSYIRQASLPMPERMESYNLLLRAGAGNVFTPDFLGRINPEEPCRLLREAYRADDDISLLKHMLALDMKITIADNDIRKVSHMCRLAGIEVRYPMLDERLVRFAAGLPSDWLLAHGELRAFYRRALSGFLPRATLEKSKHGFGLPFGVWLAQEPGLHDLADQALSRLAGRGVVREDYIARLRGKHLQEHAAYYGVMIWLLMMLEHWLEAHGF